MGSTAVPGAAPESSEPPMPVIPAQRANTVRTDMNCTECGKTFLAELDASVKGNQVVECPYCYHEHLRAIENGKVTEQRWGSRPQRAEAGKKARVWKHGVLQMATSSTSEWLRNRWLNLGQD